jgi:energy-converting hydrogenase A subunit R
LSFSRTSSCPGDFVVWFSLFDTPPRSDAFYPEPDERRAPMAKQRKRVFITDCEGPVTKNDNAAELADAFIPRGDVFFRRISLYDDYLAEVVRKPGYKAGDTLKLILPFFKAFGLDERSMGKFARRNIKIIPYADVVLREIHDAAPAYIVSTSYSPYVKAVCDSIGFPFDNAYCTEVHLDAYDLAENEKSALVAMHSTVLNLHEFTIPAGAASREDLGSEDREAVAILDEIFWEKIPTMNINRLVEETNPIGGREKARAVVEIARLESVGLDDVIYVGDSITDVEAFRLVKSAGGLAVSFNGNDWAVKEAGFAVTAANALPTAWLARLFFEHGPDPFKDLLLTEVNPNDCARISAHSSRVRKEVRSEKIGSLG